MLTCFANFHHTREICLISTSREYIWPTSHYQKICQAKQWFRHQFKILANPFNLTCQTSSNCINRDFPKTAAIFQFPNLEILNFLKENFRCLFHQFWLINYAYVRQYTRSLVKRLKCVRSERWRETLRQVRLFYIENWRIPVSSLASGLIASTCVKVK